MIELQRTQLRNLVVHDSNEWNPVRGSEVWSLNLDQIEPSTGRILKKEMTAPEKLGPSTFPFEAGTVLYSKLRPYLNKVVVAQSNGVATTELVPVRCHPEKVFPEYLAYYLRSPKFLSFASNAVAGAKMPRMVMSDFWAHEVPTPPLPEQRRIATILDQAEALRAKRRQALALLDELAQAVFVEMFGDPVTNPKRWAAHQTLGDLTDIVSGVTKGRDPKGKPTRSVPYLAVANVQDKALDLSATKTIDATEQEIARYRLQANDLLLTEGGDPDKLGRGTLWHNELPECIHQNHVFRVRICSSELHPLYLNWLVGSRRGKSYFLRSAKQTTGIASINMTQLRGFPLLVPPIVLQEQFAERIATIDRLKSIHRAALTQLDALFASLQHRAFAGLL